MNEIITSDYYIRKGWDNIEQVRERLREIFYSVFFYNSSIYKHENVIPGQKIK